MSESEVDEFENIMINGLVVALIYLLSGICVLAMFVYICKELMICNCKDLCIDALNGCCSRFGEEMIKHQKNQDSRGSNNSNILQQMEQQRTEHETLMEQQRAEHKTQIEQQRAEHKTQMDQQRALYAVLKQSVEMQASSPV
tara:strand:- start:43 stop:468 length:426 start_codon:yes stop_codon:yes gene_type:complete